MSRLIGDLEASVTSKLFARTTHRLEATPKARRLFSVMERSFVGLSEICAMAESIRALKSSDISFG